MSAFARFSFGDTEVAVNPDHVIMVRPSTDRTTRLLVTAGFDRMDRDVTEIVVHGDIEHVLAKLNAAGRMQP